MFNKKLSTVCNFWCYRLHMWMCMHAHVCLYVSYVCIYVRVSVCVCTGVLRSFAPWPCGSQTAAGMKIALITACEPPFLKCSPGETDVCRSNGTLSLMAYCYVLYARMCVCIYRSAFVCKHRFHSYLYLCYLLFLLWTGDRLKSLLGAMWKV